MIKTYILEDLDCAHCAGLIETEIGKLPNVTKSSIALMSQKLVVDTQETDFKKLEKTIKKIVQKYEPDVTVIAK